MLEMLEQPDRSSASRDRVEGLRAWLERHRLAGIHVPHTNAHQSEYLAPHEERLSWLTEFTGSAGVAVVLVDAAALFVDGRYTTQAGLQVDEHVWEIRHISDEPVEDWLAMNLPQDGRLAYDPWLLTPGQVDRLNQACKRAGGRAVAVSDNPIDRLWRDRPLPPISPILRHDERYAGATSLAKRTQIAERLRAAGKDAVVLSALDSVAWLLNLRASDVPYSPLLLAFAVLHADTRVDLFVDDRRLSDPMLGALDAGITVQSMSAFMNVLDRLGAEERHVSVDPEGTAQRIVARLRRAGAQLANEADPCQLPRAAKNPVEQAGMRAAHRRDGVALISFLAWIDTATAEGDVSEADAAAKLDGLRGCDALFRGPSFPTISAAASNGAIIHYRVTKESNRDLIHGSLYLVDSGGQYLDGTTDVTRTVAIGEPTPEMRARFTLVLKGHIAIATTRFPRGTSGTQLDAFARRALWAHGHDYDHGTGHGVGSFLSVHEGPHRISKLPNRVALVPGMIVSNEPGYYKPGGYGIRIENLLMVVEVPSPHGAEREILGFETLTLAPIDRRLIDQTLLDESERRWIDAYHVRVRAELSDLVSDDVRGWLSRATMPLSGA